ncbi:hypothetical protein NX059_006297 [Plenodomus lindquistii]|nr:hypothetical protein NX059_006297 [Plenodomus lindquistii]
MKTTYTILLTALAAQQATATWDLFAKPHNTPKYNDNVCDDKQKSGFDWSDLKSGDKNFKYGDFDFSGGWSCSNSLGKRDSLTRRTFGSKVIKNSCSKDKPASFSCNDKPTGFSVDTIDVSTEFDAELEFHYKMGDGSTCKQYTKCSQGGTTVKNTQCGGAKSVDVYLGKHFKGEKESCEIGLHHIGFDCDKGSDYTPPKAPEAPPATYSAALPSSSAESSAVASSSAVETSYSVFESSSAIEASSSAVETTSTYEASSAVVASSSAVETSSAVEASSSVVEASSSAIETPATTVCGQYGGPLCSTSAVEASSVVLSSTAVPFTNTSTTAYNAAPPSSVAISTETPEASTAASSSVVASTGCGYGGSCEGTTVVASSVVPASSSAVVAISSGTAAPQPSTPSYPPVSPPDVLPKCMNTWLQVDDKCKNNADKSCYCKNPEFTKNVIDCVTAWCGTDEETQKSLQYLIGICADHVPENPKIIEDCPSYIPLNPESPTGGDDTVSTIVSAGVSTIVSAGVSTIVSAGVSTVVSAGVSTTAAAGYPAPSVPAGETATPSGAYPVAPGVPGTPSGAYPVAPGVPGTPSGAYPVAPGVPGTPSDAYPVAPGVTAAPSDAYPVGPGAPAAPSDAYPVAPGVTGAPSAPAPSAPAPEVPVTTITYGTTHITVPMVHFTTETNNVAGAVPTAPVGLVGGDEPAQTPAATTGSNGAPYPTGAPYPVASTFGTQTAPLATGTGAYRPTSPPEFTGAAAAFKVPASAFIGAALAFFAL